MPTSNWGFTGGQYRKLTNIYKTLFVPLRDINYRYMTCPWLVKEFRANFSLSLSDLPVFQKL